MYGASRYNMMNEQTSQDDSAGLSHWGDILAVVLYFLTTLGICIWSICRPTRQSVQGFFLAGRSTTWWPIGLSLFASNISSEHFIGLAGAGAASGIAVISFEWSASFLLLLMTWVFLPVYFTCGIYTLPEYMMKRFGGQRLTLLISVLFIFSTCNIIMPVELYSGGLFIQQALGWNVYYGMLLIIAISVLYSTLGGLATVLYTDAIQVVIMIGGAVVVSAMGLAQVGGMSELRRQYMTSGVLGGNETLNETDTCRKPRDDAWHIIRDPVYADYPWAGTLMRVTLGSIHYWCTSQTIVQRSLAAKSLSHAKGAAILAGILKTTPLYLMVLPGMVARVLFPEDVACADAESCLRACGSKVGCSNIAYPKLVLNILPKGLRGLVMAVMLSAVVSSLTSMYNSVATVVTLDLWRRIRPQASQRELLVFGRLCVMLAVCFSLAWIPVIHNAEGGQIFKYITTMVGYIGAPLNIAFLLAMLWTRANESGIFWGFLCGFLLGMVRFTLDAIFPRPGCGVGDFRPRVISAVHPYYFVTIQMTVGAVITIIVSLATAPLPRDKLAGVTFWTREDIFTHTDCADIRKVDCEVKGENSTGDSAGEPMTEVEPKRDETPQPGTSPGDDEVAVPGPFWRRLLLNACGVSSNQTTIEKSPEESAAEIRAIWRRTHERRLTRHVLNTLAVLPMILVLSLCVYYR